MTMIQKIYCSFTDTKHVLLIGKSLVIITSELQSYLEVKWILIWITNYTVLLFSVKTAVIVLRFVVSLMI